MVAENNPKDEPEEPVGLTAVAAHPGTCPGTLNLYGIPAFMGPKMVTYITTAVVAEFLAGARAQAANGNKGIQAWIDKAPFWSDAEDAEHWNPSSNGEEGERKLANFIHACFEDCPLPPEEPDAEWHRRFAVWYAKWALPLLAGPDGE